MKTMTRLSFLASLALVATVALSNNADAFGGGGGHRGGGVASGGSSIMSSSASSITSTPTGPTSPVSAPEPVMALATGLGLLAVGYFSRKFRG